MATESRLILTAVDRTGPGLASATGRLRALGGEAAALAGKFAGIAGALGGIAALSGVEQLARGAIDSLNALKDLSEATGSSVENISALEDVAARTGTRFDVVAQALLRFNQALSSAKPGSDAEKVLRAIGLSAKELQAVDPSVALLKVAKALANYADDGNKARYAQELFGKTLREVAPLLNDLAERGELVARATTEQARAAEQFSNNLDEARKNVTDLARALVGDLLPALNKFASDMREKGLLKSIMGGLDEAALRGSLDGMNKALADGAERYREAVAELAKPQNEPLGLLESLTKSRAATVVANYEEIQRAAADLQRQLFSMASSVQGGRGNIVPPLVTPSDRARLQDVTELLKDAAKVKRIGPDGSEQFADALRSIEQTDAGRLAALNEQLGQLFQMAAETPKVGAIEQAIGNVQGAIDAIQIKAMPAAEASQGYRDALAALEDTDTARIQATSAALDELFRMRDTGLYGPEVDQAIERLRNKLAELRGEMPQLSEFAIQAGRNIQDALGDSIYRVLSGDFKSIGDLWKTTLARMVAQAAAARLNQALFGASFASTGQVGGWLGTFSTWLSGLGAKAEGGPITAGTPYLVGERGPELIVPRQSGTVIPNHAMGSQITYAPVINITGGNAVTPAQLAAVLAADRVRFARQMRYA